MQKSESSRKRHASSWWDGKWIDHNLTTSREWSLRFRRAGSSFGFGGGAVAGVTGGGIRLAGGLAIGQTSSWRARKRSDGAWLIVASEDPP